MIYSLFIILLVIFFITMFVDKDIFSPAALICESYLLAVICAIMNISKWDINLSNDTVYLILIGVLSFVVPSCILLHTYLRKEKRKNNNDRTEIKENSNRFYINKQVYAILLIGQVITFILYFYYVLKTVGGIGNAFDMSNVMNQYREGTSYGNLESLIPTYVNQLVKVSEIVAYISMYYIFYCKTIKEKNKLFKWNLLSILLYVSLTLLSGGRYQMISFIIGALIMWNMLSRKIENKNFSFRKFAKICIILVLSLFAFSQTRTIVGRSNDSDLISYVSSYFGGSIELLDLYLDNPNPKTNIVGKETFSMINNTLSKFGIIEPYRMHLEFRSHNGVVIGNVYTALRCFHYDFGIRGVIILQTILAIIWTIWYKRINLNKNVLHFDTNLFFYCMFVNCLLLNSYRDNFFSTTLSVSTITIILYFIIIKKMLITKKV